jgi:type II secretory pathway predicted ATPase ExeA/pSer/pThr/pTyr-binding forkhead associated (FHA) protein
MYCELFQLREPPFRLTPDPQFLFASKQHARAKAYMESTIWLADGFVVITGDIGSGKTTLIESFLEELPEDVVLAQISQTQLSPVEFLQALLVEFGFEPFKMRKVELMSLLKDFMVEQYAAGKKLLLVIDEAQNLSRRVLEEVRMLAGIEAQKEKLLRIILAGQPELANKLDSPRLEQLTQRVRLRFHLSALSKRETRQYIEHRLEIAGAQGRHLFTDEAFDTIFRYSGGVPRLINVLCDTGMLCAFAEDKNTIDNDIMMAAVDELQWVQYADRSKQRGGKEGGETVQTAAATGEFETVAGTALARLEVLFQNQFQMDYSLSSGRTIVGRTADNELQIPSKFISRHHAQIVTAKERCILEDLNSTNGIFVNGKRVKHRQLYDGDVIQVGEHKLVYRDLRSGYGDTEATDADVDVPEDLVEERE